MLQKGCSNVVVGCCELFMEKIWEKANRGRPYS